MQVPINTCDNIKAILQDSAAHSHERKTHAACRPSASSRSNAATNACGQLQTRHKH